ncbi:P-aminobenzoate N-oxygenase AurF [bacterium]|nr:P-aminobenzoate N-oxygenase AurF [bacterium]
MLPLEANQRTYRQIELNLVKNREQDHTALLDSASAQFQYEDCKDSYWNPEDLSLLYGTPLWDQASPHQRVILNQLYWVAYYAQIISAEIATIFFNQTSAAGLYSLPDFRTVCDMLDLESAQERAHIAAFQKVSDAVEEKLFNGRVFTYPMRGPYVETMVYGDTTAAKNYFKGIMLRAFGALSSSSPFLGCQYFTVRGLRTLNGKQIQHRLSQYYLRHPDKENAPIPSKISFYHFMDESFHFNSSRLISHEVINSVPNPSAFERWVLNEGLWGCQKDHFNFSTTINGIFWFDPALFTPVLKVLMSPIFGMDRKEALDMMDKCFCVENQGGVSSADSHSKAMQSYRVFLESLTPVSRANKEMRLMRKNNLQRHLQVNRKHFRHFSKQVLHAKAV